MYLSHLVRSEGMKIWTFWPKWAESVSARRQSVEQEKVWKVSFGAATYPGGGYQHFFAIFRSRHFFPATFLPFFLLKILHSKVYEPDFTLGPNEFSWDSQVALTWMSNRSSSQLRNLSTFSFHFRNHIISRICLIFFSSLWFLLFLICYNNFMMFLSVLYCRQKAFIWIWFILHATTFGSWDPSSSKQTKKTSKVWK